MYNAIKKHVIHIIISSFLLFCESLCYEEAHFVVKVSIVDLVAVDHFSHLAGIAASSKIHEDYDSVD